MDEGSNWGLITISTGFKRFTLGFFVSTKEIASLAFLQICVVIFAVEICDVVFVAVILAAA